MSELDRLLAESTPKAVDWLDPTTYKNALLATGAAITIGERVKKLIGGKRPKVYTGKEALNEPVLLDREDVEAITDHLSTLRYIILEHASHIARLYDRDTENLTYANHIRGLVSVMIQASTPEVKAAVKVYLVQAQANREAEAAAKVEPTFKRAKKVSKKTTAKKATRGKK